ncbi:MAG: diguanylate cyclase [Candidatus Electrothrix aestuarii]|uniref:diguanylate cyclase n=1 Tax=Candidatus Electrothrix aestuarii TaxID=3062594 RepID=A0AAU8LQV3_9BACT|nr:diguanylate cyclase [Candidatus Electrothrix aestuarii]
MECHSVLSGGGQGVNCIVNSDKKENKREMMNEKTVGKLTLRRKIGVILALVAVCYGAASYLMHRKTLYPAFVELEYEEAKKDINRISDAVNNELKHLDMICKDWAFWDDTYQFAEDGNAEYIESNLLSTTFTASELNFIYFFNADKKIVWGKMFDLDEEEFISAPNLVSEIFSEDSFPETFYAKRTGDGPDWIISGIINTAEKMILFVARPILTSSVQGPQKGIMAMGFFLGEDVIERIKEQTHVQFEITQASQKNQPGDRNFIPAQHITQNNSVAIAEKDNLELFASIDLVNTNKEKSLIVQVDKKAKIIEKGRSTLYTAMESIVISLIVLLLVVLLLLNKIVIKPVAKLTEHINNIRDTGDLSKRIESKRSDEIGHLTRQYNKMLGDLQRQQNELEEMAVTDGLTRLLNHRKIMEDLQREIERCSHHTPQLAVMMLDLDFFKRINDTYGHKAGDEILVAVAHALKASVGMMDIVGRYGGEEFLVVLPGQGREAAEETAEKIRRNVAKLTWPYEGLQVTVSGGISIFPDEEPENLLLQADKRLYQAKEQGRNRIVSG